MSSMRDVLLNFFMGIQALTDFLGDFIEWSLYRGVFIKDENEVNLNIVSKQYMMILKSTLST